MIKIKGDIKTYEREEFNGSLGENESVYNFSNRDLRKGIKKIKGVLRAVLNDELFIPYGVNGFYYKISKDIGIKVFYSLVNKLTKENRIKREWERCNQFYAEGLTVRPIKIEKVFLDVILNGKRIKINTKGIVTERVQLPEAMWDFSVGRVYDFDCLDRDEHPLHNPDDFLKFRKNIESNIKNRKVSKVGTKLGDIVYCTNKKRWFLVDCGGKK